MVEKRGEVYGNARRRRHPVRIRGRISGRTSRIRRVATGYLMA
jgi:hypothetical protein